MTKIVFGRKKTDNATWEAIGKILYFHKIRKKNLFFILFLRNVCIFVKKLKVCFI